MAKKFIPATDEVWRLHNIQELDCLYFQGFCEDGHYGGPRGHGTTRQGIYCCSPSGRFLASVNTTDPRRMERMLNDALDAWKAMPKKERYLDYDPASRRDEIRRASTNYPADGLALRVYTRDMPRNDLPDDWRSTAWNVDSMWLTAEEARSLLPRRIGSGRKMTWPEPLAHRLVRHHLVDNVRGQTNGYRANQVLQADLETEVLSVRRGVVELKIVGTTRATTTGQWPEDGKMSSAGGSGPHERGMQTRVVGYATWNTKKKAFIKFEVTALGTRWGRTQFNFRQDDVDETPIAFAITFDPEDPGNKVAPAEFGAYGWR